MERVRLPWACSERRWCDFSGRRVSSVTMKGRAAAGFGARGRSAEVQSGGERRREPSAQVTHRHRDAVQHSQSPRGYGWDALRRSPHPRSPQSCLEVPSRCLRISVSNFVIEKTCGGKLGIVILPGGFAALATLPVTFLLSQQSQLPQAGCFLGSLNVLFARVVHLAMIRCPRSSAGSESAFGIILPQIY